MRKLGFLLLFPFLAAAPACATYDGPPEISLQGAKEGLLADPKAPIVLEFSKATKASSIKVEIAPYVTDIEGNLGDEDDDPKTKLDAIFTHDPKDGDTGGEAQLSDDDKKLTIRLRAELAVGARYVLLIEPGLEDTHGAKTKTRRRIVFGYKPRLDCNAPTALFKSGYYFFLANVTNPIAVQVKLWADVKLDEATGAFTGKFTAGRRNPDPNRCPTPCPDTDACRLLPAPECVAPSEKAGSVDEFSDFVPNTDPNTGGYSFDAEGCAIDQDETTVAFSIKPVDVEVQSPHVTLKNTAMSASFELDPEGVLRASGSLVADAVLLGTIDSGKGQGDLTARSLTADQAPPGIPKP